MPSTRSPATTTYRISAASSEAGPPPGEEFGEPRPRLGEERAAADVEVGEEQHPARPNAAVLDPAPQALRPLDAGDAGGPSPVAADDELEADDLVGEERRLRERAVLRHKALDGSRVVL